MFVYRLCGNIEQFTISISKKNNNKKQPGVGAGQESPVPHLLCAVFTHTWPPGYLVPVPESVKM